MTNAVRAKEARALQEQRDQQVLVSLQDWRDSIEAQRLSRLLDDLISLGVGGIGVGAVTESYVTNAINTAISNLVSTAPSTLNTLVELAAALNNDANFATTVTGLISQKIGNAELSSALANYLTTTSAASMYATKAGQRYQFLNDSTTTQTTYTVPNSAITENGRTIIELSNNSLTSITIDSNAGIGKTSGDSVHISITGTYAAQALVADGVTLQGDLTFSYQHQTKTLIYKGSNTWKVVG